MTTTPKRRLKLGDLDLAIYDPFERDIERDAGFRRRVCNGLAELFTHPYGQ